jgi:hypothetical protein
VRTRPSRRRLLFRKEFLAGTRSSMLAQAMRNVPMLLSAIRRSASQSQRRRNSCLY